MLIAVLGSVFIYSAHFGLTAPAANTVLGILSLYLLMKSGTRVWFWSGFFIGLFWFWWIGLSFIHYHMIWAIPLAELGIALIYGGIFWLIAKTAFGTARLVQRNRNVAPQHKPSLSTLSIKALGLLILSYIHPFGFDWFKPELLFVESYLGIEKWQFALILASLCLTIIYQKFLWLLLIFAAFDPDTTSVANSTSGKMVLAGTRTSVEEKWNRAANPAQFETLFQAIDQAVDANKTLIVLPESVFPLFLNRNQPLFDRLLAYAKKINIVTGALYWDGETPRNAAYIFTTDGKVTVANKVILVPFGESNPLPDFLSKWVNKVFYDGAVDYKASPHVADYHIGGKRYRNAICFEATSEKLYEGRPKRMIVLSNNGWFTPSTEPTLQRLLLQYYSRKYGTTIYHAVNMAPSYTICNRRAAEP
jgi:apolipoprotein N-acyltransferase